MSNTKGKPWVIGQDWDGSALSDFFNGAIDEVAFYDHSLTHGEISKLYNEGVTVSPRKVIKYTYDVGGNIQTKKEYDYTTGTPTNPIKTDTYTYGDANWKDKLTSFNGKAITYDEIGNPLTYDGQTFSWEEGRQLAGISKSGLNTSYKYNSDRIRTEKTVNGVTFKYHVVDGNVTFESNGSDNIYYTYDSNDNLVSIELNGVEYYYVRNAQGDIIALIDGSGNEVVSYTYDTWGKFVSIDGSLKDSLGIKNPYRYRGYRYDTETGLYYLQSRYYNPEWGRFINVDDTDIVLSNVGSLLGHNIFGYCINNPINMEDSEGYNAGAINLGRGMFYIPGIGQVAAGLTIIRGIAYVIYKGSKYITQAKKPASSGSLQKEVEKGQAAREVDRVDKPHVPGQKPHVHFKDGTSLNNDGTIHDAHKGKPKPNNKTKKWLKEKGWKVR